MSENKRYTPAPIDTSQVTVPDELHELIDYLAGNAHEVWAKGRMSQGWTYGESDDSVQKKNQFLKPYENMTPTEKLADINSVEETVKLILHDGYKIEKTDVTHWEKVERNYFKKYHNDKNIPVYRAPLVIGLVGGECADLSESKLSECIDEFAVHVFEEFKIPKNSTKNIERETPVYIISEFASKTEIAAAKYASKKYGFELISVNNTAEIEGCDISRITIDGSAEDYITRNSFMLLALWDGMNRNDRAGSAVRKALLEYDRSHPDPERTFIDESHAVYHIVLPGSTDIKFAWRSRLLLPYILESGESWYTLRDAQIIYDRKQKREVIMGQTAATLANGAIKSLVREDLRNVKQKYKSDRKELLAANSRKVHQKLIAEANNKELTEVEKAHMYRLIKNDDKKFKADKKALRKKYKNDIKRTKNKKSYNAALEKSKKDRYDNNCNMLRYINRAIELKENARKTPQEYDLLNENVHGKSLSADAVNLRHLRIDTIATSFQKSKKKQTTLVALFAGIGLGAYGIFSDLASSRSLIGVLGGLLSAAAIIVALIVFICSQRKNYHSIHLNMRLLSEMLRVKTYLNAAGIYDVDVCELLSERQQQELEWAQFIYRGWETIDAAAGYYDPACQSPIAFDDIRRMWIGSPDTLLDGQSNAKVYVPSSGNGQMDFDRGRGSEYFKKDKKLSFFRGFATVFTVVMTIIVTVATFVVFLLNAGGITSESWQDLFTDRFTADTSYTVIESLAVFFIGIIPSVIACALIFHESQMYSENAQRYKWMAVKYQKLTSCLERTINTNNDDEVRSIFKDAARAAVEEIGEWTLMTANSETSLPF